MTKKAVTNETIEKAMDLTKEGALVTLKSATAAAQATEHYVQGLYKVGYEANVDALKVAKGYWDATSEIRQDWIKLFATTGENLINAAAKMELPLQKQVMEFGQSIFAGVEKTVENATAQAKTAAK